MITPDYINQLEKLLENPFEDFGSESLKTAQQIARECLDVTGGAIDRYGTVFPPRLSESLEKALNDLRNTLSEAEGKCLTAEIVRLARDEM